MADYNIHARQERVRSKVLHTSAELFLQKGYVNSTLREIAQLSGIKYGSLTFAFKSKENILSDLVGVVLDYQFERTERLLADKTKDGLLIYASEITLQLYMAESSEHIRELYTLSYSQHSSSEVIYEKITMKLAEFFRERYPDFDAGDFYEKELAAAGIMRNYLTRPSDMFFPMERKVRAFLENTLLLYEVDKNTRRETIEFVSRFDWKKIAEDAIDNMLAYLESKI
ncbi:MAG: TetR/AcrR family transcriptional regulator [Clostridia bacterium]|nr:TetR/AcrR family transcriptional regulator [Clostridia bacterium]